MERLTVFYNFIPLYGKFWNTVPDLPFSTFLNFNSIGDAFGICFSLLSSSKILMRNH